MTIFKKICFQLWCFSFFIHWFLLEHPTHYSFTFDLHFQSHIHDFVVNPSSFYFIFFAWCSSSTSDFYLFYSLFILPYDASYAFFDHFFCSLLALVSLYYYWIYSLFVTKFFPIHFSLIY